MIAITYLGQQRHRALTRRNHELLFQEIQKHWPTQVYDFTQPHFVRPDYVTDWSGYVQVKDFIRACEIVPQDIVIRMRTDSWFSISSHRAVIEELKLIVEDQQDVSYVGYEAREDFAQEYQRLPVTREQKKVQDFAVMVRKDRINRSQELYQHLDALGAKQLVNGNKTWKYILNSDTRAWTVRCQMYLVRNDYEQEPTSKQVGWDFVTRYRDTDLARAWWQQKLEDLSTQEM